MRYKVSKKSIDELRNFLRGETVEYVKEQAEEIISFEENPLEYIIQKYPSLDDTLKDLLTDYYRDYVTGIFVVAPKPTTFKILLHNGQMFYLIYGPKSYIAKVSGKRYFLLNLNEEESAVLAIADLLMLGRPPGSQGPDEETASSEEETPAADEAPAEETPAEEEPVTESIKKKIKLILRETPEQIINDLEPLGYKKKDFKPISGKQIKLLVPGKERKVVADKIAKNLNYKQDKEIATKLTANDGTVLLVKPIEQQGDATVRIELEALAGLLKQLKQLGSADIKVGNKIYKDITDGYKVPGTPKADLALTNSKGTPVIFISHKDGDSAKDFQQYGGVTAYADNPEVKAFAKSVLKKSPDGIMPQGGGFKRQLNDEELIRKSIYGSGYGGAFGENNVQVVCQGPLFLEPSGKNYELKSNHNIYNGTVPGEGYTAYLMATFRRGRNDLGVKSCRMGIYPEATRKSAQNI